MNTTTNALVETGSRYLQQAIDSLKSIDISLGMSRQEVAPFTAIIERIADADENSAIVIARTLAQQEAFDQLVADQIAHIDFGSRFEDITKSFDSIRDDAKRMISIVEKGAPTFGERVGNVVMKLTRGDISDRFSKIRDVYSRVVKDVEQQVIRERIIIEAYSDFRSAIKEAEIHAGKLKNKLESELEKAKKNLEAAAKAVEKATESGGDVKRAEKELERDEALRAVKNADDRYQIAKDIAENLMVAYSVSEATMAKLTQSHMAKDRIYKQAVTFYRTNSSVLSVLKATYTGVLGLNEATKTLDAMQEGISKSLESIADIGTAATEAAIRKGYGPGIRADAVRKLVDSVVDFQVNSTALIAQMRQEATKNAEEIRDSVEQGKRRIAELQKRGQGV